jgi:hypothetical protein
LQNGDEIQLAVNGPKLGFIVPSGEKSKISSIGLSHRLSLFRRQAMRPYKTAITTLSCLLLLVILGAGGGMYWLNDSVKKGIEHIPGIIIENDSIKRLLDSIREENKRAEIEQASVPPQQPAVNVQTLIDKCKDDIYYIRVDRVYLTDGSHEQEVTMETGEPYRWIATGFLLNDGRFVTARHCVQAWRFEADSAVLIHASMAESYGNVKIVASINAINRKGKQFTFKSTDFKLSDIYDGKQSLGAFDDGTPMNLTSVLFAEDEKFWSTDWAYIKTSLKGTLTMDKNLSNHLQAGTELHVLGFPKQIGVSDTPSAINPAYNKFSVGFDGLDNSGCFLHTRGIDNGNSGGPIFTKQGNKLVVVGIVSRRSILSDEYGYGVPISAIDNN